MLFSIIIPVYNTEKYLKECLDTIINQTHKDIEIIIVNDGSTDNSINIIRQYAEQDKRIIIIDQENKGLSEARNAGITAASGDYLIFIDSDDYIDLKTCEHLNNLLTQNNCSIAVFGRYRFWDEKKEQDIIAPKDTIYNNGEDYFYESVKHNCFTASSCNKAFRAKDIKQKKLTFTKGILYEDLFFVFQCLFSLTDVATLNLPLYYYRQDRPGSIVTEIKEKDKDVLITVEKIEEFLQNNNKENVMENPLFKRMIYEWVSNAVCFKYPKKHPFSSKANKIIKFILHSDVFNKYVRYFAYSKESSFKYKIIAWLSLNIYPLFTLFIYLYYKVKK